MSLLAQEYYARHKVKECISPLEDGFCFFNDNKGTPARVCLTSTHNRSASNCPKCSSDKNDLILEIFAVQRPIPLRGFDLLDHRHIGCNQDISEDVNLLGYVKFQPKGIIDLERWLWSAFVLNGKFTNLKHFKLSKKDCKFLAFQNYLFKLMESSKNHIFLSEYLNLYNKFLVGRKYL